LLSVDANADAQNRVRQYRLLVDESEREYQRDLSDMDQKIRALKGEPKWGPIAVTGYENSRTKMVALTTRTSAIQRESADLLLELLSNMSAVSVPTEQKFAMASCSSAIRVNERNTTL
jgi:hypothetical protein